MTKENFERIEKKLDVIIKLLANKSIEGNSQKDSIIKLGHLGLDRNLIAEITGTTVKVVNTRLYEARKKKTLKRTGRKKVPKEVNNNE